MTRPNHTGQQNPTYWVDGHRISAYSASDAVAEYRHLYGGNPDEARLWTEADGAS